MIRPARKNVSCHPRSFIFPGLSRLQQLLIAQRLVDAPVMPSYCGEQGGLVIDRVRFSPKSSLASEVCFHSYEKLFKATLSTDLDNCRP